MAFGHGKYTYDVVDRWAQLPPGWTFVDVVGVDVDSKDRVYVFHRGVHPVMIFDLEGDFLKSWGKGIFRWPHSLRIGPDDSVYCVDGDHTVRKFTPEGRLLMTIGKENEPSDTGCVNKDCTTIKQARGPFNFPTGVAFGPSGNIYVSDGYSNARVHKFSNDGKLLLSWGEPGTGPGQFNLPHGICVDGHENIYIADRENCRIQLFDPDGEFITQWDANRPTDLFIHGDNLYVTELGFRVATRLVITNPKDGSPLARVSILNLEGELVARWGGEDSCALGNFFAPHTICVDSRDDLYVGEVTFSAGGKTGIVPSDCHTFQKFLRRL